MITYSLLLLISSFLSCFLFSADFRSVVLAARIASSRPPRPAWGLGRSLATAGGGGGAGADGAGGGGGGGGGGAGGAAAATTENISVRYHSSTGVRVVPGLTGTIIFLFCFS